MPLAYSRCLSKMRRLDKHNTKQLSCNKKRLERITIDVDTHGVGAMQAYYNSKHIIGNKLLREETHFSNHGWHFIFWLWCYPNEYNIIRQFFDDHRRLWLDNFRIEQHQNTLWSEKRNKKVVKGCAIALPSGFAYPSLLAP